MQVTVHDAARITTYVPYKLRHVAGAEALVARMAEVSAGPRAVRHIAGGWVAPDGTSYLEPVDEYEFLVPFTKVPALHAVARELAEALLQAGCPASLVVVSRGGHITTYLYT